jgi:hypothetical protein
MKINRYIKLIFSGILLASIALFYMTYKSQSVEVQVNDIDNRELTTEEKVEDFLYLYNILKENYPYFEVLKRTTGYDWLANKKVHLKLLEYTENDEDYYQYLIDTLSKLEQGHTNIIPPNYFQENSELYNDIKMKPWQEVFNNDLVIKRYNYWNNLLNIKSNHTNANTNNRNKENNLNYKIIEDNEIAYLSVKSFAYELIEDDKPIIYKFLSEVNQYPYLIIDIRGNGGGATKYWRENIVAPLTKKKIKATLYLALRNGQYTVPFLNYYYGGVKSLFVNKIKFDRLPENKNYPYELKTQFENFIEADITVEPNNPVDFNGKIFLLVDGRVFSSAEQFAIFSKVTNWATLVGTVTRGDGIGINPIVVALPNSGLVVSFPTVMGLNPDGSSNEEMKTVPDILINTNNGEDALEKTLQIINHDNN